MSPPVVTAEELGTKIELGNPKLTQDDLRNAVTKWVESYGSRWPADLSADGVAEAVRLLYLPYWVMNAEATATWYASVGTDSEVLGHCRKCNGSGKTTPVGESEAAQCDACNGSGNAPTTTTTWTSQSGLAKCRLRKALIDRYDKDQFKLRTGEPDASITGISDAGTSSPEALVLAPAALDDGAAKEALEALVEKALIADAKEAAEQLGSQVKNLKLTNLDVKESSVRLVGYPIYSGTYSHQSRDYDVQMDALTGKFWADAPVAAGCGFVAMLVVIAVLAVTALALPRLLANSLF